MTDAGNAISMSDAADAAEFAAARVAGKQSNNTRAGGELAKSAVISDKDASDFANRRGA